MPDHFDDRATAMRRLLPQAARVDRRSRPAAQAAALDAFLHALGEHGLAVRCPLLAPPHDRRWAHPYGDSASATN
ncbi:hypothetical protein [Streptomyces tricolor]|uniref:hypothetical protein n=1 Tax=Streptomyces tricolor TaxID=68277 RepID=UPI0036E24049